MATILYSNYSSYYSMIARLCLAEKQVTYDLHDVDIPYQMEQFAPEYVAMQPNMTVPVLDCDGNIIADSRLILHLLISILVEWIYFRLQMLRQLKSH